MPEPQNLRAVGDRIEQLLDDIGSRTQPKLFEQVTELMKLVSDLYGGGLARIVQIASEAGADGATLTESLLEDELVSSLLLVHGLHPRDLRSRVEGALESVRPLLARHSGGVDLVDLDPDAGAALIRLSGSCDGCPSSAVTLRDAVEKAIFEAAPEILTVDVAEPDPDPDSTPVRLTTRPAYDHCPTEVPAEAARAAESGAEVRA